MARILMSLMLIAGMATAVNAANVYFTDSADTAVSSVQLLAGESVDLKVWVDSEGATFTTADLWMLVEDNSGLAFSNQTLGAWAFAMFSSFSGDYLAGLASMNQVGVVELGSFTVTTTTDGDGTIGAGGESNIGMGGVQLSPFTVAPVAITPEPATLALLVMGGLAAIRRRR